jgi:hypothetical protein
VRVVRQFREAAEAITLEKVLVLPDVPTMGARLDLRAEGVEDALTRVRTVPRDRRVPQANRGACVPYAPPPRSPLRPFDGQSPPLYLDDEEIALAPSAALTSLLALLLGARLSRPLIFSRRTPRFSGRQE